MSLLKLPNDEKKFLLLDGSEDICISCLKIINHFNKNYLMIDGLDFWAWVDKKYLTDFYICNDCFSKKFKDNIKYILDLYEKREYGKTD